MDCDYDIVIVGGGMVGAGLAVAMRELPYRTALVEAVVPDAAEHASFDDRAIVLSEGSRRAFDRLGLWGSLEPVSTPIRHIHVSDRGHFGAARIHADEEEVPALGYVIEARMLGGVLNEAVQGLRYTEMLCPARFEAIRTARSFTRITVHQEGVERHLSAKLVVAADGTASRVRERTGLRTYRAGYGQTALVANVLTDRPHGGTAYERFTETGPMALLPFSTSAHDGSQERLGRRWSLVWTVRDDEVEAVSGLDESSFLARLQQRFGGRAGRFVEVHGRAAYPLRLQFMPQTVRERLVFVGNAAHTLHPVAGQGLNLGLRDVITLARHLGRHGGDDPGDRRLLVGYARDRRSDHWGTVGLTDGLARVFSSDHLPVVAARNVATLALDLVPPLRHRFARRAMGLRG